RQCAGREGVRLARHRLLRRGGADRLRLRARAGLCAHHGGDVCRPQLGYRHPLRPDRSAREDRGMSRLNAGGPNTAPATGLAATLGHIRYVLGENRVTAFAFGLFALIVLAALIGPYVVPYDPLASNTTEALKGPSVRHWFGTDQLGRDIFSRVI